MKNLLIVWLLFLFGGLWLIFIDLLYQTVWEIKGVPALSTLGGALFLLALSSMLNWICKIAWEEHNNRGVSHDT